MIWYRVEDGRYAPPLDEFERSIGEGEAFVRMAEYEVLKETPCGVWIGYGGGRKFVLQGARKQFAWPTKEEAIESFHARKRAQVRILSSLLRQAERMLTFAQCPVCEGMKCERSEASWGGFDPTAPCGECGGAGYLIPET